jgi:hypothetical protein
VSDAPSTLTGGVEVVARVAWFPAMHGLVTGRAIRRWLPMTVGGCW